MSARLATTRSFTLTIEVSESLSVAEIWPDGDAPDSPTIEDVRKAFLGDARRHSPIGHLLSDWGLEPTADDLIITDDTAFRESMASLEKKKGALCNLGASTARGGVTADMDPQCSCGIGPPEVTCRLHRMDALVSK